MKPAFPVLLLGIWDTMCATKPCTFTQIRMSRIAFLMINFRLESILFLGFFIVCTIYIERKRFSAYVAIICDIIIVYSIRNLSVLCMNKGCYCVRKIIILEWILCRVVSNWYSMITFQIDHFFKLQLFPVWTALLHQISLAL
jgi:hypothetical protein